VDEDTLDAVVNQKRGLFGPEEVLYAQLDAEIFDDDDGLCGAVSMYEYKC
jgi:hypothetical protein